MTVDTRHEGHVAVVTFAAPPNNHVSVDLLRTLADAFDTLDADRSVRATVLASAGKVFCAGADLAPPAEGGPGVNTLALYEQAARLFGVAKPMVAAVQGAAVGAGLGLALVADFRVAAPEARFAANFVKLGFHPGFGISHSLPRLVGQQHAARLLLTGERVSGEAALAIGLADVVAPVDGLLDAAVALTATIAGNAPLAVQATRATLRAGLVEAIRAQTDLEAAKQAALMQTADFAEGIRAVRERRAGNFIGE
ncbi:enoyl-CoA hydratase/isomerase family protein [Sphingomonas sp.]|uniref:enoyl-CoA hydratase/isomerase family protein n=1 Tax=Sphingomonas sp. TaxID=28214 RepID=UPI003CC57342